MKSEPNNKRQKITQSNELAGSKVNLTWQRHAFPVVAGIVVFLSVFGIFNSELLAGQIAYFFSSRNLVHIQNLDAQIAGHVVDPNAPPRITINKINVSAPVIFETKNNEPTFIQDLHNGVVHYPGTAIPGDAGNVVVFGHSSGQWWAPGHYKFIFTLLDKLAYDDKIFVEYRGIRYIYRVYNTYTIAPTDLTVLNQGGNHMLTLITCTPVGTSTKRLIIQAQQISPAIPSNNVTYTTAAKAPTGVTSTTTLPAASSFWDDLLHLF